MTREEARQVLKTEYDSLKGQPRLIVEPCLYEAFEVAIDALTEKPLGTWRKEVDNSRSWDRVRFYCSECGEWQTYGTTDYCPNCGAKMVEPQERSEE